jgi:hypothetical protein
MIFITIDASSGAARSVAAAGTTCTDRRRLVPTRQTSGGKGANGGNPFSGPDGGTQVFLEERTTPNSIQSAAALCSIAATAGRLAFRNVRMCRTASGIFSGTSFHGYMLTCELGASIATSIATA